jgi:hypothetical protein
VVRRPDGINVTSRARTALDLARFVPSSDLLSIIEQVIHDGAVSEEELRDVALEWWSPQRPWIRRFLELLDRRLDGGPAESHGETILGDALAAAGLVGLARQFRIDLPGYGPARFDLASRACDWPSRSISIRRTRRRRDGSATPPATTQRGRWAGPSNEC